MAKKINLYFEDSRYKENTVLTSSIALLIIHVQLFIARLVKLAYLTYVTYLAQGFYYDIMMMDDTPPQGLFKIFSNVSLHG